MSDPQPVAPAAETPIAPKGDALSSLTDIQRSEWLKTGELPKSDEPAPEAEQAGKPDEADASSTSDAQPPVEAVTTTKKPRHDMQARLGQETEAKKAALARAEAAERRASELEARLKPAADAPVETQPRESVTGEKEPEIGDFLDAADPYAALAKAMGKWEAKNQIDNYKREIAQAQAVEAVNSRVQDIQAEGLEKYPDWVERMTDPSLKDVILPPHVRQLTHESEFSVDVLYHLSKNPGELRALAAMEPLAAAKAIGRLETRLSGDRSRPAAPSTSAAPSPPTTLGKKPAAPVDDLQEALRSGDTGRYIELQNQREFAAMKAGRR